jgi:hypothetical protein
VLVASLRKGQIVVMDNLGAHRPKRVRELRAPYLGETRAWLGEATWKALARTSVEVLVDAKV